MFLRGNQQIEESHNYSPQIPISNDTHEVYSGEQEVGKRYLCLVFK